MNNLLERIINEVYIPLFYNNSKDTRDNYWKKYDELKKNYEDILKIIRSKKSQRQSNLDKNKLKNLEKEINNISNDFACVNKDKCIINGKAICRGEEMPTIGDEYEKYKILVVALENPINDLPPKISNNNIRKEVENNSKKNNLNLHWRETLKTVQKVLQEYYDFKIEFSKEEIEKYFFMTHAIKCYPFDSNRNNFSRSNFLTNCKSIIEKEINILNPEIIIVQSHEIEKNTFPDIKSNKNYFSIELTGSKGKQSYISGGIDKKSRKYLFMDHPNRWRYCGFKHKDINNSYMYIKIGEAIKELKKLP